MDELERVVVAAPCPISWEAMPGDERVRYCSSCSKNVYNISDMTSKEASEFLQENGTSQCVRLFRRNDGKVMTDNCPKGLRAIRNRCRLVMRMLAGCAASFMAFVPIWKGQGCSAQDALPYDGEPMLKTEDMKNKGAKGQKTPGQNKHAEVPVKVAPANPMPATAGLIALPPKNNAGNGGTGGKQVMVGGDVCGNGQQTKNNSSVDRGNFVMGKMKATTNTESMPGTVPAVTELGDQHGKFERDSKAYNMYMEAKVNESAGNLLVAQIQYKKAIAFAKEQQKSDPKFLSMLESALAELRKKISGAHPD